MFRYVFLSNLYSHVIKVYSRWFKNAGWEWVVHTVQALTDRRRGAGLPAAGGTEGCTHSSPLQEQDTVSTL